MNRRIALVAAVVAVTLGSDQLAKHLALQGSTAVIEGIFELRVVESSAWTFRRLPPPLRQPVTVAVSALALGFLLVLAVRGSERQATALALVLGGAAGNFVDRIFRGQVVDFIQLSYRDFAGARWPSFNLADLGIFLGLGLLLREVLRPVSQTEGTSAAA